MLRAVFDGLSLIDTTGRLILASTLATLLAAGAAHLFTRSRYTRLQRDLERGAPGQPFAHPVLNHIVRDAEAAARLSGEPNTQAIIEDRFQAELKPLLGAERFVKAATGLVIILGLLGTFYGLTLSIGRLVHLVSAEPSADGAAAEAMTAGLTHALAGMAVAFSNSLLGIASAVVLTVLGVLSNVTDRRVGLMVQIETYLDRLPLTRKADSRLEDAVARFEAALRAFSTSTREFGEFNAHLKDNIQRMSLSFGDFSDALKGQVVALTPGERR
jgi:hypothetical protein